MLMLAKLTFLNTHKRFNLNMKLSDQYVFLTNILFAFQLLTSDPCFLRPFRFIDSFMKFLFIDDDVSARWQNFQGGNIVITHG